jgi:peptidyl-prolyl cis-trans isomerase A (cyclophilin A)
MSIQPRLRCMIRPFAFLALLSLFVAGCGDNAPANGQEAVNGSRSDQAVAVRPPPPAAKADVVRVRLETDAGPIVLALDARHAPVTAENFLRYVDEHRLDGTSFYRAARTPGTKGQGFIQGGTHRDYRRMLPGIAHEPTGKTGLRHGVGAISMARTDPGTATGDFFIAASALPSMDAHKGDPGYAAFGRVTEGMDIVRRILAAPTLPNAGRGAMRGQMIAAPVKIVSARRVP